MVFERVLGEGGRVVSLVVGIVLEDMVPAGFLLNSRFNGHRSDVKVKPKACELSQHFHNNKECSIDRDLKVYILQDNVTGSWEKREYFEDRWITRLNSKAPNGMNSNLKEFAKTFYALF